MNEYIGVGSIEHLGKILEPYNSLFLVTGKVSYEDCGAKGWVDWLDKRIVVCFNDFEVNPELGDVYRGCKLIGKEEVILAIGGGSVIDMAKLIKGFKGLNIPLVVIPTTAGSGSEATGFATYYIDEKKYSLQAPDIYPDYVIVDGGLTFSMPPRLAAITGMDALAHAIESYWSMGSTEKSKEYSVVAMKTIFNHLVSSVEGDEDSRIEMSVAANTAGKAINIAKTTACHAISYMITSKFGIPHGHAVALTLPRMIEFNGIEDIAMILDVGSVSEAATKVRELMVKIGLETSLRAFHIENIDDIVRGVNQSRLENNPRPLTEESIREMLL